MAEIASVILSTGITSTILQVVVDRVAKFLELQNNLAAGVNANLRKLKRTLMRIQARVDQVEKKQSFLLKAAAEDLLEDLNFSFLDAEDMLETIGSELERKTSEDRNQVDHSVSFFSSIPSMVTSMQKKLDELITELERYCTTEVSVFNQSISFVDELSVFGRETDKCEIKKLVLCVQGDQERNVSVIPIVGMGGIGKTTLAQLVYSDADVHSKFNLKMWVSVCIGYDMCIITKSIIESATGENVSQLSNLDSVQVKLKNTLKGKKFFLVLDGVCDENLKDWDRFRLSFRDAMKGSKIVMTTRSELSTDVGGPKSYQLDALRDDACWEIIKKNRGILNGETNLEVDGLVIAKKCKGFPWLAKLIGSSLKSRDKREWDALLKYELWELQNHKERIYPKLKLFSYDDMPSYLKRCFAYCSIFPRDHVIEKDDLVQLWAAEGFLQSQGTKRIGDIGRQYFEDLCSRSFFSGGDKQIYKMHELVHDLARFVSTNLCCCMEDNMSCLLHISPDARHASLLYQNIQLSTLEAFYRFKKLRTFALLPKVPSNLVEVPHEFFERLKCLRVLNLSRSSLSRLPESIGILIHLRYLNLSHTLIERLPKPITTIYGLETLKLISCPKLLHLPENLKDLIKLRHLDFDRRQLSSMPIYFGNLTGLETLHAFKVGKEKGYQIEELKNMRCLRGSISITNLDNVADDIQAEAAMLHNKQYLDRLELEWNEESRQMQIAHHEVLNELEPHAGLKELRVTGYCGSLFPKWIVNSSFSKLESIELENCPFCELLPPLGELPALKKLLIQNLSALNAVDQLFCGSSAGFPLLDTLTLRDLPELSKWSGLNETVMPCLRELSIETCPKLDTIPSFQYLTSLQSLEILYCPQLQSLPEGRLPPSLNILSIWESGILKDRCKMGEGADWNKISGIPTIIIDDMVIPAQRPDNQVHEVQIAPEYYSRLAAMT